MVALERAPAPARQSLPVVAGEGIPGSPDEAAAYFRCGPLRATMSGTACVARWRKLNGRDAPRDPSPCQGCDAGMSRDLYLVGNYQAPPPPADLTAIEPKLRPVRRLPHELEALLDTPDGLRNRDVRRVLRVDNQPARKLLQAWCEAGLMVKVEAHKETHYRRPGGGLSANRSQIAADPPPERAPQRKRKRRAAAGGKGIGAGWSAEHGVDWLAEARAAVAEWGADEDDDASVHRGQMDSTEGAGVSGNGCQMEPAEGEGVTGNVASEPATTATATAMAAHLAAPTDTTGETMDEDLPEGVAALLDSRAGLTAAGVRDVLDCSASKASRALDGWVRAGLIERHGNGRYTFYRRPGSPPPRAQSRPTPGPSQRPAPTASPVAVPAPRPEPAAPEAPAPRRPGLVELPAPSVPGKGLRVALEARVVRVGGLEPTVEVEVGGAVFALPVTEEQAREWATAVYQRRRLTLTLDAG